MKNIPYRIGNLELRRTENIRTKKYYLEIVEWLKDDEDGDYVYTIATFEKDKDGYKFESTLDRIVLNKKEWNNLRILVKLGFEFLEGVEE
jgi:hypothetical protein